MRKSSLFLFVGIFFLLILAVPLSAYSADKSSNSDTVTVPADATPEQVREIMAGLSDEQVRSLLLSELKKEADAAKAVDHGKTGLAGFVHDMKEGAIFVRERFQFLFSGAATAPSELPKAVQRVMGAGDDLPAGKMLLGLVGLTILWMVAMFVFKKKTTNARKSISRMPEGSLWFTKMGRLFLRAVLDLFGVVLISTVVFVCYLTFFEQGAAARPVLIAWLAAMVFLALVKVVTRFLLAPHAPALRYLPMSDEAAQYLFRWSIWIGRVMATGLLCASLIRLEGGSEALWLLVSTFFGFLVAFMLVLITLWNKKRVADHIRAHTEPDTLVYNFADSWHMATISYVLGFWVFWVFALMVFGSKAMLPGLGTLLIVPGYFLVDWVMQRLVRFAVEMASSREGSESCGEEGEDGEISPIVKFQYFLSKGFRALVLCAAAFLLMELWGLGFPLGRETVEAALNILLTLVLAYIFWVYIAGLIEKKLREKQPEDGDSESGEGGGGPGGDRFSTLLQLVKKFIFVTIAVVTVLIMLSSLGVDIGPLIAGASVFGLAIGFGAQTLVKDIISGIFFLLDDAFRVGDYIIVGSARGNVEEISVRSFKLRHHLGPLYTIPFGSINEIQNMSRDWAVMKLQYLVPFDTDIQKVKKIIKKINKEVRAIPELNEFMLSDIKSQGVKAMEEYGMRMRVKFMTKPGGQFTLRKLVLAKMRKEFEAAGIEFARPRVSVSLPENSRLTPEEETIVAAAATKGAEKKVPATDESMK